MTQQQMMIMTRHTCFRNVLASHCTHRRPEQSDADLKRQEARVDHRLILQHVTTNQQTMTRQLTDASCSPNMGTRSRNFFRKILGRFLILGQSLTISGKTLTS